MKTIGIDIGGTSIKGAVIEDSKIIKRAKSPTNAKNGRDAVLQSLFTVIDALLPFADDDSPIGIGSAGDINPANGEVIYATGNLPNFTGLPLGKLVTERYNREVTVINDAVSGLIGELVYGAGKGCENLVLLTLGTGLGCGILLQNKVLTGSRCRAGRAGHMELHRNGRGCTCGNSGCIEQYVSATGLTKTAVEYGMTKTDCLTVFKLAYERDSTALKVRESFFKDFKTVLQDLVNLLDPEKIIIGGGLVELKQYWWEDFLSFLPQYLSSIIKPAELGNDAGFFGSQYTARNKQFIK